MNNSIQIIDLASFDLIGIAVRTANANGQAQKDIGELWGKFMGQNIIETIPNKVSYDIYCVYTDYESDENGAYTTILACKVSSLDVIPEGLVAKQIPATKYQAHTASGKLPDCVVATWTHIWQTPIARKYMADFDVYGEKAQNPENAEVITYLSVK